MASDEVRARADSRLDQAAAAARCADPRPPLRERLRALREGHAAAFERARTHYEQAVLPALAEGPEPLQVWVDYARFLGELTSPGRLLTIDGTGRAAPCAAPEPDGLVLYLPDDAAQPAFAVLAPLAPTPAQQASVDLLVHRRLSL